MVIGDIVKSNARLFPNKMAMIDHRAKLTWSQINARVNRLAQAMLGLGLKKGDRAAIISESCHEFVEFLFAVAKVGVIGVCVNYRLTAGQVARILNDCTPSILFVQERFAGLVEPVCRDTKSIQQVVYLGGSHGDASDYEALLEKSCPDEPSSDVGEPDLFLIQYTTGTTGTSKGAMITHKNVLTNCMMRMLGMPLSRDDIVLNTMPLFAAGSQAIAFVCSFLGTIQVIPPFTPESFVEMVEKYRVTYAFLLPATTFKTVREYLQTSRRQCDLSSLRKIQPAGGQHCSAAQLKEMLDYFKVPYFNSCKVYGSTEAMPGTYLVPEDVAAGLSPGATAKEQRRLESDGKPILNGQIRIVDDNDNDVPPGEVGEILLCGDQVVPGYWNNPQLTARVFRRGWFHTSDLGRLDEDGYLYFEGRKDFVIKTGGLLVGPEEVETVIQQHEAVAEAAVIGVPDEKWGQIVKALVCLKPGKTATEEEIRDYCRKHLAGYQVPKSMSFIAGLPREIAMGKIDRRALIQIYGGRKS